MTHFLAIHWDVNPEIFSIGPIHLRYYGVLMVGGFVAAYFLVRSMFRREQLPPELLESLSLTTVLSIIIGARLGHVFFYEPADYVAHPWEIVKVWNGGLASHGAAVGILLGTWWWSRKHKKSYLWTLERIVITVPLAGALVRIGNLMNSEIYGGVTTLPWGFIFERNYETLPHHPTQIYEALAYVAIFGVLWYLYTKKFARLKPGMLFGIFLILLFGARFGIEFVKNPQVDFEQHLPLDMGQLLSIPFILAGVALLVWSRRNRTRVTGNR
jgi:prolipoprotein diacylglyceryl transferase